MMMPRRKIGLALSGGGARGFAHLGVLKVLVENNIHIDMIAGCSVGSLVGGAFAAGMSPADIDSMAREIRWRHLTRPSFSPLGLLSNAPMTKLIRRHFPVQGFEDLRMKFAAVACDLNAGEQVVITSGDLATAIRASCAVPAVFTPVRNGDKRLLVDGGVVSPIPVDAVKAMGADIVIAVDLLTCGATFRRNPRSAFGMLFGSAMTLLRSAANNQDYRADIVIAPQLGHIRPDRLKQREDCLRLGDEAAHEKIDEIRRSIESYGTVAPD